MASVLLLASSSYQHCRAFGEAESAVIHHQDRGTHARAAQKPPLSSYPEQGAGHVGEMSGKPYKRSPVRTEEEAWEGEGHTWEEEAQAVRKDRNKWRPGEV